MHLISTEDVQNQPLIGIWELHILEEQGNGLSQIVIFNMNLHLFRLW